MRFSTRIEEFLTGVRPGACAGSRPLRPCSSPTSFHRQSARPYSATMRGRGRWTSTTPWLPARSSVIVVARSTRRVTASSRPSTAPRVPPCDAPEAICEAVRPLGIDVRAGLHTGEIELRDADIDGIAVHIGQRVQRSPDRARFSLVHGQGPGGRFWVSRSPTVAFICSKGCPDEWRVFAVEANGTLVDHSIQQSEMTSGFGRSGRRHRPPSRRRSCSACAANDS